MRGLLLLLLLVACGPGEKRLPSASGAQGEILVVMDKGHWEGSPGTLVRELLESPIPYLPQREPYFKVVQVGTKDLGSLLASHHSLVIATIGPGADTIGTGFRNDLLARGQLVLQVSAVDGSAWQEAFASISGSIVPRFQGHQFERIRKRLTKTRDPQLVAAVEDAFDLQLDIPGGFRIMKQDSDFIWLQRDRMVSGAGLEHNVIEGLFVHHRPYRSDTVFNVRSLVDMRDEVTRTHVEGPAPGSHMIVQREFGSMDLMPVGSTTELDGRFAYSLHGLYGMEGAKMGGPFVSISSVCEPQVRLVTLEAFVYAPQFNKREYMRELEAILRSARFASKCIPLVAKG